MRCLKQQHRDYVLTLCRSLCCYYSTLHLDVNLGNPVTGLVLVRRNDGSSEPLTDFANGEILFQCLCLIGSGACFWRLLIAAEHPDSKSDARDLRAQIPGGGD